MSTVVSYVVYGGFLAAILLGFAMAVAQGFSDARWLERRDRRDRERRWRAPQDAAWQQRAREAEVALELAVRKADGRLLRALGVEISDGDAA